jgi:ParB family chromosome partitioning protein
MSGPLAAGGGGIPGVAVFEVPVDAIEPNHQQPRSHVTEDDALHELADSIREHGVLQPLIVALAGDDGYQPRYQLIAGERRWRAAHLAGLATVPVMLRDATPREMLELALVENLQRADLNPLEAAHGYLMLMEEYGLTQEQVAERVGRSRPAIANTIRLLQLPAEVREMLMRAPDVFTEGHARAVLAINSGDAERIHAMQFIIANKLTVRQAEEYAKKYNEAALRLTPDRRGASPRAQSLETRALEEEFTRAIEMKARLQRTTRGKGSLTLYFTNEEQLQRLYQRLVAAEAAGFGMGGGIGGGLSAMDHMIQNGFNRE